MFRLFRKKPASADFANPAKAEIEIKIGAIYVQRGRASDPFPTKGCVPLEVKNGYVRYSVAHKLRDLGWTVYPSDMSCTVEHFHQHVVFYAALPA